MVAQELLRLVDKFMQGATSANDGVPPLSASYDAATSNCEFNLAFVGLLSDAELAHTSFFSKCDVCKLSAPYYPFGFLRYKCDQTRRSWVVAGCYGSFHAQKRCRAAFVRGCKGPTFVLPFCIFLHVFICFHIFHWYFGLFKLLVCSQVISSDFSLRCLRILFCDVLCNMRLLSCSIRLLPSAHQRLQEDPLWRLLRRLVSYGADGVGVQGLLRL